MRVDESRRDEASTEVDRLVGLRLLAAAGGTDQSISYVYPARLVLRSLVVHGDDPGVPQQDGHRRLPYSFAHMDVRSPRSLAEALRIKSEKQDAVPIAGGTDLMVELNFDRIRPQTILNLDGVVEL